jgi:hypothetical protein
MSTGQTHPRARRKFAGLCAAMTLLLVALPGPAFARAAPQVRFKATVEGVQTVTWTQESYQETDAEAHCGDQVRRNGSERTSFRTERPLTLRVTRRRPGSSIPRFKFPSGDEGLAVLATIDRAATNSSLDTCTGRPLDLFPEPPDCGTKQSRWLLIFFPAYVRRDAVLLDNDYRHSQPDDPFQHCATRAYEWPNLQAEDPQDDRRLYTGALSTRKLFNPRVRTIDVRGQGSGSDSNPDGLRVTVQVSWHVVLKRVR